MLFKCKNIFKKIFLIGLLIPCLQLYASGDLTIEGFVTNANTGDPLPGANVIIVGSSLGSSTDLDGKYTIIGLSPGSYVFSVTYIGYKTTEKTVAITSGEKQWVNFSLEQVVIEGETIVVSAQREGQMAAINQQINALAIKNIVSADKIEELPEANAAEAVGRLPGVSLQREGGEGSKVVIRGLAPKYNKVQIDGVDMVSTDPDDRSTDLSMISPYMLGGIEVTKSALADQEADQLGGTVNFILKGASYAKPKYQLIVEGGYNGLRNEFGDYRLVGQANRRLFNDLFGISLHLDYENRNRSSNTVSSDYKYLQEDNLAVVNSLFVEDITRNLKRFNASLLLDYVTTTTDINLNNMISRIYRNTVSRSENSSDLFGAANRTQYLTYSESFTTIMINQLRINQYFGGLKIDLGLSYSYSKNDVPEVLGYGGLEASPLDRPVSKTATPTQIPGYMKNDISEILLSDFRDSNVLTKEDEFSADLNFEWEYEVSNFVNLKFKTGGKYEHRTRMHDFNTIYLNTAVDPSSIVNEAILAKWPWMADYASGTGKFSYEPFIDYDYDPGDFMGGEYSIERIPDLEMGKELIYYLEDYLGVDWAGSTTPQRFVPNFHTSRMSDYSGTEDYWAGYFMPTLSFGKKFTFIPGIRYEQNKTKYTGVRGNAMLQITVSKGYVHYEQEVTRKNEFFLPMIHARYKPLDWFDVRASYTHTLSRPSYTEFLPSWHIYMTGIDYRNPNLRPAKSENYDLYFSFYNNKIGLFTIGGFAKNIEDLIFSHSEIITSDTMAVEKYGLTEELTGQLPSRFKSNPIWSFINNPNNVTVRGIELEWQSNLWYLPGLLKNFVFNINYTYTFSEVKYPRTVPIKEIQDSIFGPREVIVGNADSSFTAPLLFQPDHILNLIVGYDFKGFSIRASMQYKSDIFSQNNWRPDLRGLTEYFYIYDMAISQALPIEGLILYGNVKNISKSKESDLNVGTEYMSNKQYYGMTAGLGIKYVF